jgi:ketosteroid isomerase-like protein
VRRLLPAVTEQLETVIRDFFSAMNAQDADAVAALAREDIAISIGPNEFAGRDALRGLALQTDEQLSIEIVPVDFESQGDNRVGVSARRVARWRGTGEPAGESDVRAVFTLDPDGTIARVELA